MVSCCYHTACDHYYINELKPIHYKNKIQTGVVIWEEAYVKLKRLVSFKIHRLSEDYEAKIQNKQSCDVESVFYVLKWMDAYEDMEDFRTRLVTSEKIWKILWHVWSQVRNL